MLKVIRDLLDNTVLERNVLSSFFGEETIDEDTSSESRSFNVLFFLKLHYFHVEVEIVYIELFLLFKEFLELIVLCLVAENIYQLSF